MTDGTRYKKLGLRVGLELHQQLDTTRKLYCHCPTVIRDDDPDGGFARRLRPTQSEMGEIDPAALFEFQQQKQFYYEYYNDTTCLVEADEEPPHELCDEAIDICLIMANFLKSKPVDEIHPMRKIVIDGSNTTGFQRTCIVATGGSTQVGEKSIGIQTICLEEDAARKITEKENTRVYRLDRLGIPLIEVATAPDIHTPSEAQEVALNIGLLLRSTGKVKRGLGTIRQDVNVSISGGAIIEIKGFQQLDMLSNLVELEALRQERLLEIHDELVKRGVSPNDIKGIIHDVSDPFSGTEARVIRNALNSGGVVLAVKLQGFAGLMGKEIQPDRRFGTELSDYAKVWGQVGGIFHTDELPKYGISNEDVSMLRAKVGAEDNDAVVMVAAPRTNALSAMNAVVDRARQAIIGIPAETRTPLPNATSMYARPRPGAQRMYPETDVRPVQISPQRFKRITKSMPETLERKENRFVTEVGLSEELASQIVKSTNLELFEKVIAKMNIPPTLVAVTLENTLVSLHRDGVPIERLQDSHLISVFEWVSRGGLSPEAIPAILTHLSNNPKSSVKDALGATDLGMIDEVEL
jgi:glutamyl-tRNA(Gln) amidotransferase subunit E